MSARTVYSLTIDQMDELLDQVEKLSAICDLVLCETPGTDLRIDRNNFASLLCDPVNKVRNIAKNLCALDLKLT